MYKDEISAAALIRRIISISAYVLLIFVLAIFFSNNIGSIFVSNGSSMKDTIDNGDVLLINRLAYKWNNPKRFDLIYITGENRSEGVKRIVGLPGELIVISDGKIYINDKELTQDYWPTVNSMDMDDVSVQLSAEEYFVLGDNLSFSEDSRSKSFGAVNASEIGGRPWFCCYPFTHLGRID